MNGIRGRTELTLTILSDDNPQWWVNSSYAVHPDIKSHTINDNRKKFKIYIILQGKTLNNKFKGSRTSRFE